MKSSGIRVVITGHSRGLGAALVEAALARGWAVLGLSRQALKSPISPAPSDDHGSAVFQQEALDLSSPEALQQWLRSGALAKFAQGAERLIVIHNAATVLPVGPLGRQDATLIAQAVSLNVTAGLLLANAAATLAVPARDVLHISSGAGRSAYPGWSVYGATKAALDHHARCATLDAVPGLKVVSLAPGVIDSDMQASIRAQSLQDFPIRERFEAMKSEGQLASPASAAEKILGFLQGPAWGRQPVEDIREVST